VTNSELEECIIKIQKDLNLLSKQFKKRGNDYEEITNDINLLKSRVTAYFANKELEKFLVPLDSPQISAKISAYGVILAGACGSLIEIIHKLKF